jgi:hypothetical protein
VSDRLRPAERDEFWTDPRPRPEPALARLLREMYPDPAQFDSAESFARFNHDDVRDLADDALADQRLLAYLRRACERASGEWLVERIARLDAENARRKRSTRRR